MSGYSSALVRKKLINLRHIVTSSHDNNQPGLKETFNILQHLVAHLQGLPPVEADDVIREVVDFLPSADLKIKKLVYHLLSLYSEVSEEIMLNAYNGILDDRSDPNPIVRAVSMDLSLQCLQDENEGEMEDLLHDPNYRVKIKALSKIASSGKINTSLLLEMVEKESEAEIVVLSLFCLSNCDNIDEIGQVQDILVNLLTKGHYIKSDYLVNILLYTTNRILITDKLSNEEKFQIMNSLERFRLNKSSYHVVVETYRLMLKLCKGLEAHVCDSVTELLVKSLVEQYKVLSQQTKTVLLKILIEVCKIENRVVGCSSIDSCLDCFCPQPNDIDELKAEKLKFLLQIANQSNSDKVFSFVVPFLTYHENDVIVKLSFDVTKRLYEHMAEECWRVYSSLVSSGHQVVLERAVTSMAFVFGHQKCSQLNKQFLITPHISCLMRSFSSLKEPISVDCALWLLSYNKEEGLCEDLSKILAEACNKTFDLSSKVNLLNCCARLFVSFPRHFALAFKKILQKCVNDNDSLKDLALFYSSAIKSGKFELLRKLFDAYETVKQENDVETEILLKSTDQQFCSLKNASVNWTFDS